jgi:tetratricopeptide (TPR) repeat protein
MYDPSMLQLSDQFFEEHDIRHLLPDIKTLNLEQDPAVTMWSAAASNEYLQHRLRALDEYLSLERDPTRKIQYAVEILALSRMRHGELHESVARALLRLSECYLAAGLPAQTLLHAKHAWTIARGSSAVLVPLIATTCALAHEMKGEHSAALKLLEEARRDMETQPAAAGHLFPVLLALGKVHLHIHQYEEAEQVLLSALAVKHSLYQPGNQRAYPDRSHSHGQLDGNEMHHLDAEENEEQQLETATLFVLLGKVRAAQRKIDDAVTYFRRAGKLYLSMQRKTETAELYRKIAGLLADTDGGVTAVAYARDAVDLLNSSVGFSHPRTVEASLALAFAYVRVQNYVEAKHVLVSAVLAQRSMSMSMDQPEAQDSFSASLQVVDDWDGRQMTLEKRKTKAEKRRAALQLADTLKLLGTVHLALEDVSAAVHSFCLAAQTYGRMFGAKDPKTRLLADKVVQLLEDPSVDPQTVMRCRQVLQETSECDGSDDETMNNNSILS